MSKNIYIYGHSDDCHEIETDFDRGEESYGDVWINDVLLVHWEYNSDWKITITGHAPNGWKIKKISGTSDFIHISVPDDSPVYYKEVADEAA